MTNLKAGSGPTREPAQGPQICLILGDLCWSSNLRSVDPEPSLKGLRSAERSLFFIWGPELTLYEGSDVVPHPAVQQIYIYIYIVSPKSFSVLRDVIFLFSSARLCFFSFPIFLVLAPLSLVNATKEND